MPWIEFFLITTLLVQVVILFVLAKTRSKFIPYIGAACLNLINLGLLSFIVIQVFQILNHLEMAEIDQTLIYICQAVGFASYFLAVLTAFKTSTQASSEIGKVQQREQWLSKVNENIPVAIFVTKDGELLYKNATFEQLQARFKSENPFDQLKTDISQQEVWLHTENGDGYGYWVNKYSMDGLDSTAYIVTDITAVKLQGSFIQKIAQELNSQQSNNIQEMTRRIHAFLPSSILYIGSFDAHTETYEYVTHRGVENFAKSNLNLNESIFKHSGLHWFDTEELSAVEIPSVVYQAKAQHFGGILLKNDAGQYLGVILLILPEQLKPSLISDLLLDFLAIFSLRVKSDLEHKQDKYLLAQSSEQYKAIIESSKEAIVDLIVTPNIYLDESVDMQWEALKSNSTIAEVNTVFLEFFELDNSPTALDFFSIKSIKHMLHYVLESGFSSEIIEVAHQKRDGEIAWLSCNAMASIDDRRIRRIWLMIRDITDSKNHIQHLEHQARHDKLTSLANRSALHEYLDEKIDQANQFGFKMALMLIDLNRFKEVNDALGHHYGDVLLKKIEPRIRQLIAEKRGFLARLGGDEFAIVLPSIQSESEVTSLAHEVSQKVREPFDLGKLNVEIGCSIGISFYPADGHETSTLIRCADVAMYQAKKETSGILFYRSEMDENSPRRLALMVDMNKGLKGDEFFLVFQPKLDLSTNEINSAEALIRWQHPELELIAPSEFIPLAEMSDVIITMTHWVIDQALQQIKRWQEQGIEIKVSVNVSTKNLLDEDLTEFIKGRLDEYKVPAHLLEIEITESALMVDPERALNTLNKISEMGVSISVDDFGTGYSSFIYLRQLPINTLKIDIMFVRNMCGNQQDEIIVNSIINLAHNLSLNVVAEGAESFITVERLKAMGCNFVQGYFVSKPVPADEFINIKNGWNAP